MKAAAAAAVLAETVVPLQLLDRREAQVVEALVEMVEMLLFRLTTYSVVVVAAVAAWDPALP